MRFFITIFAICISLSAYADGIQQFKDEFAGYKRGIERDFNSYKSIMEEEFSRYKGEIELFWDDVEVSDAKRWVEYINRYRVRKIVDFESRKLTIEIIGGGRDDVAPVIKDMLLEDLAVAFRRDPVSFNTEKRLGELGVEMAKSKVESKPVVAQIFTDHRLDEKSAGVLADKLASSGKSEVVSSLKSGGGVLKFEMKLPDDTYKRAAERVVPHVKKYASKYKVDSSLVMSVIYHESRFNPMAKSYVPAYGLMQIVPKSAGVDAIKFIEGRKRILSPSFLYNSENNVKIGSVYLHLLFYRYFKGVKDLKSRLYCSIAAYNTGAGNVAYAFNIKSPAGRYNLKKALPKINAMSPSQVYSTLAKNLRYAEAKNYLRKVTAKIKDY